MESSFGVKNQSDDLRCEFSCINIYHDTTASSGECGKTAWFLVLLHTSFFLLPVLGISVEHQARAALLPLQLNLLFIQPLFASLLARYIIVQSLVALPLLTAVIILKQARLIVGKTTMTAIQIALYHRFSHRCHRFKPTSSAVDCASSSCSFCGSSVSVVSVSSANCLCPEGGAAKVPGPNISCPAAVKTVSSVAGSV